MNPYYHLFILVVLMLSSCVPNMHTGPEPHSISFEKEKFTLIQSYFSKHPEIISYSVQNPKNQIPESIHKNLQTLKFSDYKQIGDYQLFICGNGVVGKAWGFIHGPFTSKQQEPPSYCSACILPYHITYLKHLEGSWYRIAVM